MRTLEPNQPTTILGHKKLEKKFLNLWKSNRVPHAILLSGPRGVGKATFAYQVARFILHQSEEAKYNQMLALDPENLNTLEVPDDSSVNGKIANKAHPDLLIIERSENLQTKKLRSEIVVDDLIDLGGFLRLTASGNGWRIIIIDTVDEMNRNAANSILKLLEEPPRQVLFILISNYPGRLLPTIRSRCHRLVFSRLSREDMLRILGVKIEGHDSGTMEVIYNLSNGSAGVALEMLSEDILECLEDIVALLLSPRPLNHLKIETIFDNWARSAPRTEPNWLEQKLLIVIFWMSQGIRRVAQDPSGGRENLSNENSLLKILVGLYGLRGMCEKLTKAEELIVRSKRLNLDRKETFFSFVGMLND